jgi:hypothetical protein
MCQQLIRWKIMKLKIYIYLFILYNSKFKILILILKLMFPKFLGPICNNKNQLNVLNDCYSKWLFFQTTHM